MTTLMSVGTEKGLAQYSKIQNWEETGQLSWCWKNEVHGMLSDLASLS